MTPLGLVPPPPPELQPIRYSRLKLMALSAAHYQAATVEETYALERGSAVHALVLDVGEVLPWDKKSENGNQCPRRGKDFDRFQADHPEALILMPDEYSAAKAQADAILSNAMAMRVLTGAREREIAWSINGRTCAGRPDVFNLDMVAELKCTVSAQPRRFRRQARALGYCGQLAWYADGLRAAHLADPHDCYIVASESKFPYVVTVFHLNDLDVERGRREYRAWFEQVRVCEDADVWPGYSQAMLELGAYDDDVDLGADDEAA